MGLSTSTLPTPPTEITPHPHHSPDHSMPDSGRAAILHVKRSVHGYLLYKKTQPPRTLPQPCAYGSRGVLGGWASSHGRGTHVGSCNEALCYKHRPASACMLLTLKKTRTERFQAFASHWGNRTDRILAQLAYFKNNATILQDRWLTCSEQQAESERVYFVCFVKVLQRPEARTRTQATYWPMSESSQGWYGPAPGHRRVTRSCRPHIPGPGKAL